MSDCANVEMRELLPDLMHDALSESDRSRLEAHLATCADCAAEFALLESARRVMAHRPAPAVDVESIVRALPRPARALTSRRLSALTLRLAAALTFVSLGGISVVVARSFFGGGASMVTADSADTLPGEGVAMVPSSPAGSVLVARSTAAPASVGLSELGDADLESLLGELDAIEAIPLAEPESTPGERVVSNSVRGAR